MLEVLTPPASDLPSMWTLVQWFLVCQSVTHVYIWTDWHNFFFRGTNRWEGSLLRTDAVWVLTYILYFLALLLHIKTLIRIITYNFEIERDNSVFSDIFHPHVLFFLSNPVFGVFCPTHNIDLDSDYFAQLDLTSHSGRSVLGQNKKMT